MIFLEDGRAARSLAGFSQYKGTRTMPCCGRPQMHLGRARLAACPVLGGGRYAY
jgi:hypothetical protein